MGTRLAMPIPAKVNAQIACQGLCASALNNRLTPASKLETRIVNIAPKRLRITSPIKRNKAIATAKQAKARLAISVFALRFLIN